MSSSIYSHSPYDPAAQGGSIYAPAQGLNLLAADAMAAGGAQVPAAPMQPNQLLMPQPPAWQAEWQRVYDQMAALGHADPQTVAYETIAKYGLGPYARQPFGGGGFGSEVGGGGGEVSAGPG